MKRKIKTIVSIMLIFALLISVFPPEDIRLYADEDTSEFTGDDKEHSWEDWRVIAEPTCTKRGEKVHVCKVCGKEEKESIASLGHDFVETESSLEDQKYICMRCGETRSKNNVRKTKVTYHFYNISNWENVGAWIKEGTSWEYDVMPLERCVLKDTHDGSEPNEPIWPGAKMEAEGENWYKITCYYDDFFLGSMMIFNNYVGYSVPGGTVSDADIMKLREAGIKLNDVTTKIQTPNIMIKKNTEPSTDYYLNWDGDTKGSLIVFGRSNMFTEDPPYNYLWVACDHSWEDWKVIAEPTCTKRGIKEHICEFCGKEESEYIALLGHDYVEAESLEISPEEKTYICKRCGEKMEGKTKVTYHFYNAGNWENVGAWIKEGTGWEIDALPLEKCVLKDTDDGSEPHEPIWPGAKMEAEGNNWYKITCYYDDFSLGSMMIFNNYVGDSVPGDTESEDDIRKLREAGIILNDVKEKIQTPNIMIKKHTEPETDYYINWDGDTKGSLIVLGKSDMMTTEPPENYSDIVLEETIYGDANGDGMVSSSDAVLIKRHLAGWNVEFDEKACDVNMDGTVDSADVVLIQRKLAGYQIVFGA